MMACLLPTFRAPVTASLYRWGHVKAHPEGYCKMCHFRIFVCIFKLLR